MSTQLATLSSLPVCAGTIPTRTRRSTTLDKIIATFCSPDDLLNIRHHRNDPQAKITDREILTIAILACQEFGRNMRKALHLFSFVPSDTNRAGGVYNFPPPLGSPRFARGTAIGAPTRFPLLAGGTLRRGFQLRLFL